MNLDFDGEVWFWRGPAPWFFVSVPERGCADLHAISGLVSYGWGMIPASIRIGAIEWTTSLWPKDDGYIVPIKADVRRRESIEVGDRVRLHLEVGGAPVVE